MLEHALVDGTGSQTAADEQDGLLRRVESQALDGLLMGDRRVEQGLANGVARQDNLLGREETLHALVGHTDLLGLGGQVLIRQTGITVLLLDECGNSQTVGCSQGGSTGITAHADGHVGLEFAQEFLGEPFALQVINSHTDVRRFPQGTEESPDGQSLDLITSRRYALHLHAPHGSYKQDTGVGLQCLDGIGNRDGREDMSACSASADDDS